MSKLKMRLQEKGVGDKFHCSGLQFGLTVLEGSR